MTSRLVNIHIMTDPQKRFLRWEIQTSDSIFWNHFTTSPYLQIFAVSLKQMISNIFAGKQFLQYLAKKEPIVDNGFAEQV